MTAKDLILKRIYNPDYTIGKMFLPDGSFIYTLELPWRNNQRNISCISHGEYSFQTYHSQRLGKCFKIYSDSDIMPNIKDDYNNVDKTYLQAKVDGELHMLNKLIIDFINIYGRKDND